MSVKNAELLLTNIIKEIICAHPNLHTDYMMGVLYVDYHPPKCTKWPCNRSSAKSSAWTCGPNCTHRTWLARLIINDLEILMNPTLMPPWPDGIAEPRINLHDPSSIEKFKTHLEAAIHITKLRNAAPYQRPQKYDHNS